MRIIHVAYSCEPGRHTGGVSKAVHEMALAQHRAGLEVEVWSVAESSSDTDLHGYRHRRLPGARFFGSIGSRTILRNLTHVTPPAVVHLHNTFHALNLQVGKRARSLGFKTVYHPHGALDPVLLSGCSPKSLKKRLYCTLFEIPSLNRANAIIALTEQEKLGLAELGVRSPIHVVPNGIELASVSPVSAPESRSGAKLLFIGRINPKKRLEDIIEALPLLVSRGIDPRLSIAGNEKQFPEYTLFLRALADRLGVSGRIAWLGFRDERQKAELFAHTDVFVHASESEGMAMAILEAMAHATPVVASKGCYMSAAANAGALVEYDFGPGPLAAAISGLLARGESARINQGRVGRDYVRAHHAWEAIASQLSHIYENC